LNRPPQFWIEGVLLIGVGILGILGNCLTLVVLGKSKKTNFHQLLIVLSVTDTLLVSGFFQFGKKQGCKLAFFNTRFSEIIMVWYLVLANVLVFGSGKRQN
jgi:hypothetical protein